MKKIFKLTLIILLIVSLAFVVTGCGNKNNDNEENNIVANNNDTSDNGKSKTYNAFNKVFSNGDYIFVFEGKTDMGEGVEDVTMTLASKGDNVCIDVKATSSHATIMYKDNVTYIISNDDKMYMTSEGKDESIFEGISLITEEDLKEIENQEYQEGKETIDGAEYEYEEYKDAKEGITERYYFAGNELKYIKSIDKNGAEEIMKVIKISSDVEDSIFQIPSDYEKLEM